MRGKRGRQKSEGERVHFESSRFLANGPSYVFFRNSDFVCDRNACRTRCQSATAALAFTELLSLCFSLLPAWLSFSFFFQFPGFFSLSLSFYSLLFCLFSFKNVLLKNITILSEVMACSIWYF